MKKDFISPQDQILYLEQELKNTQEVIAEIRNHSEFLSKCAIALSEINTVEGLYAFTGKHLYELMGNEGIITIVEFENLKDQWEIMHIEGIPSILETIAKLIGMHPRKLKGTVRHQFYENLLQGKLTDMGTNLEILTNGKIKGKTSQLVSKVIGLRSIHSINIQKDTHQFGNITLVSTSKTKAVQKEVIEQFVFLVSIFLEKQLASKRLKQQEENFREIIESSKDVHYKQDFNSGRFLYIAPSVENILGYPVSEVLEMDFGRQKLLFHEDDIQRIRNFPNQLVDANKSGISFIELEFRMYTKSGEIVWIHGTYSLKTDEKGNPSFIIGLLRDVTDRKAFETELLKAKEKAEESDRLKSAFLANLSHEIRTPMNGIIGFTELLQRHEFSPEDNDRFLDVISQSSERMLNIINDLIDISIIESGQMKVEICPVHINQILDSAYNFFIQKAQKKGLNLVKFAGLNAPDDIIATDSHKLYAILSNLINNACKFTQNGKITFGYTKSGNYLLFSVEDTGIGMDDETQAFVFDRFRQAEISSSRTYEGAGLGLSIARSYVEMLGGKIRVESQKGKGSVFYFTLPVLDASDQSAGTKPMSPELHSGFAKKIKILIAEDNEESDLLLTTILEEISSEILHTESGISVVDICRENPDIDLILMDIKLTGQSGIEATKQIRSFNKNVVIVGQTAYAQQGDPEKIILAGCNGYISKPILKQPLMDEIQKHFQE